MNRVDLPLPFDFDICVFFRLRASCFNNDKEHRFFYISLACSGTQCRHG
jgi:hypothetical protein